MSGGIGFLEILTALILALLLAPYLQKQSAKFFSGLNAFGFVQKNGLIVSTYLLLFSFGWIIFMVIMPQLYMFDFSFRFNLPPPEVGGPKDVYTLKNYRYLVFGREGSSEALNWLHLGVFVKTIVASVLVTVANFAICYPMAYYMAQSVAGRSQRLLFLCLLLPFWVNEILRAFAFKLIFADQGLINTALIGMGIWDTPFDFLRADVALYTGLTYAYLLLMIFPLYNAIESLDHNQIEAARDLGASWTRIHFRVVMPYAKPGIASGCTMVFMLSAGALAAPNILGGPSSLWFTQIIFQWYNTGGNWPQGAAYSFVLLIVCIAFVMTAMKIAKVSLGDLAKK
ncbi:MAG: ABC transporter permease [Pseudomonadota bacterium]